MNAVMVFIRIGIIALLWFIRLQRLYLYGTILPKVALSRLFVKGTISPYIVTLRRMIWLAPFNNSRIIFQSELDIIAQGILGNPYNTNINSAKS